MTVTVANRLIQGRHGLSHHGALALAFIDGGVEWLTWAAGTPAATYNFPDETVLVSKVQQGLHASPVTWLATLQLWISPVKLMTFSLADLRTIARAEGGATDPATMTKVDAILSAHGIFTQADLRALPPFLAELGVAASPMFQNIGLNDSIALMHLITLPEPQHGEPSIQDDAATFALQQARTPEEFADYYRAYTALVAKLKSAASPPDTRAAAANAAVQTLLPLMFGALDCPQVSGLVPPKEVAAAVNDWLRQGRRLGFSRLSEGVCRILDSTTYTNETGAAAHQIVHHYLANAQSFLAANEPKTGQISQDGRSCVLPAYSENLFAELLLGPAGTITLRHFRRIPPPTEST